jgi:hypothetical protein
VTTSQALVGPLPTIRFRDGSRLVADPPKNTIDPRWRTCTDHRTGCDCREAELNEDRQEWRNMYREVEQAAQKILAGHPTWNDEGTGGCACTGCQIVRAVWLFVGNAALAGDSPVTRTVARLVDAGLTPFAAREVACGKVRLAEGVFVIVQDETSAVTA